MPHFSCFHGILTSIPLLDHPRNSLSSFSIILSMFVISGLSWDTFPSLAVWLFVFIVTIEFILFVVVTDFDTFPSVNCLYDESSFHWQLPRDSSAPLAITLKLFEFSSRFNHFVSGSYNQSVLGVIARTFARSSLWLLFPYWENIHSRW